MHSTTTWQTMDHPSSLETLYISIQKEKIQLFDISLHALIEEHREELTLENKGAPFIAILAHLIYLKSLQLIPQQKEEFIEEEPEATQLIDQEEYCSFRQAAKTFSAKEREQTAYFLRSLPPHQEQVMRQEAMIALGIEEFSRLFSQIWQQAQARCSTIVEEEWKVSDALSRLRIELFNHRLLFDDLFSITHSKDQLIVTFLAILELMKNQEAYLIRDQISGVWYISGMA